KSLEKGYWFPPSDKNFLLISFWNTNNYEFNTVSNIALIFKNKNSTILCFLILAAPENSKMLPFFEAIAPSLKLEFKKKSGKSRILDSWLKTYPINDYLIVLDNFIKYEKPIIDSFIKVGQVESLFPPTTLESYQNALKNIEKYRRKKSIPVVSSKHGIQLKALKLTNIGHYETISLDLSRQVTCLIGENGSGKSTLLRSIALGLTGITPFEKEATQLSIQRLLRLENALETKITYFSEGSIQVTYDLDGLKNENEVVFRFDKDSIHHAIEDEDYHVMHPTFNLSGEKSNLLKYLVVGFSQQTHVSLAEKNSINGINYVENPNIEDVRTLIFNKPDNRFDDVSRWFQKAVDVETPFLERKRLRAVIEKLTHIINQLTHNDFRLLPILEGEARVASSDFPQGMPLSMLSQGYYNMMGWVGFFMKRLWEATPNDQKETFFDTAAICLIDEIDTYLHPKWQAGLLDILAKSFPKTQFVVTTHSPLIITHLKNTNDTVTIYKVSTNRAEQIRASGQDIRTTLRMHFGVERRPLFYQAQIDHLFLHFEKWEAQEKGVTLASLEKQLKELEKLLGETDPDVETATRILEALKIPLD
ncbi:MAG: hypothetical protein RL329_1523, partial [Bacteroidota bacterium]